MADEHGYDHNEQARLRRPEQVDNTEANSGPEEISATDSLPTSLLGDPRLGGRGNGPVRSSLIQSLQASRGNRAVSRFVQRNASAGGSKGRAVKSDTAASIEGQKSGGSALNEDTRTQMEGAFDHDFSGVRVHTDSAANTLNQEMGANAFATGNDIFFREGAYDPGNEKGRKLIAHELTHVVQQKQARANDAPQPQASMTASMPSDAAEVEAETVAARAMSGETVDVAEAPAADIHGSWLGDAADAVGGAIEGAAEYVGNTASSAASAVAGAAGAVGSWAKDAVGDITNTRDNEEYLDSMEELRHFMNTSHSTKNFQSSTKLGMFDAAYAPAGGSLTITCKCKFNFENGNAADYPSATPEQLTWGDAEKTSYKSRWLSTVSSTWSSGGLGFFCQKDWWEHLKAAVKINFVEVTSGEHFKLDVTKIPPGAFRTSSVGRPKRGILWDTPGHGTFDSNDLDNVAKPGGSQIPAAHEAGHMLGLDDEYGTGTPSHSGLVKDEFGHSVSRGPDGRIMSGGMDIQPEHGVTFLEALKKAAGMDEWGHAAKSPKPVPAGAGAAAGAAAGGAAGTAASGAAAGAAAGTAASSAAGGAAAGAAAGTAASGAAAGAAAGTAAGTATH